MTSRFWCIVILVLIHVVLHSAWIPVSNIPTAWTRYHANRAILQAPKHLFAPWTFPGLRRQAGGDVADAPSVKSRRKRAEVVAPRVPKNFSSSFEAVKAASECGQAIKVEECNALLSYLAQSAKKGYSWADMDRALAICDIMTKAGVDMDASTYRDLFVVLARNCWRNSGDLALVFHLCKQVREDPIVQVRSDQRISEVGEKCALT